MMKMKIDNKQMETIESLGDLIVGGMLTVGRTYSLTDGVRKVKAYCTQHWSTGGGYSFKSRLELR